jgi:7-keto-8-aminopelargonate synthetase-like enzyme
VCAASIAALDVVETEPMRRENLWKNRERFVAGLKVLGIGTGVSETPIVPVMIGDSAKTLKAADKLFEYGVYATAIRPPTVPNVTARIRSTLMSTHSKQDIDMAVALIGRLKQEGYLS